MAGWTRPSRRTTARCASSPRVVECARHLNIELLTWWGSAPRGEAGHFTARVRHKPALSTRTNAGCSECTSVCPISVPNAFDEGARPRKAIYRPFPQAVPNIFAIDKKGTSPCKAACPAGTSAQGYIALIAEGRYAEALEVSRLANPFTSVCGRVCYHPCETACSRHLLDGEPVSIASLKRFMADWAIAHGDKPVAAVPVTRKSAWHRRRGPCLTTAQDLAYLGYAVTVYESTPRRAGCCATASRLPPAPGRPGPGDRPHRGARRRDRMNTPVTDLAALRRSTTRCTGRRRAERAGLRVQGEDLAGVRRRSSSSAR